MTTVHVHHIDPATGRLTHVADIACPDPQVPPNGPHDPNADPALAALDYAWRRTQNIDGSWSRGPTYPDGAPNPDYSADITRIAPLHLLDCKLYGLRSSMVGDVFELDGRRWAVAGIGFQEIGQ